MDTVGRVRPHHGSSLLLTLLLGTLAATGCVPQDTPGPDEADDRTPTPSQSTLALSPADAEHPTETLTAGGVSLKVPPQWHRRPADALGEDEELLAVWEANGVHYGEVAVLNGGDRFGGVAEGMDTYIEDIAATRDRVMDVGREHTPTEVEGADSALRTDYTYDYPGGTAHGVLIGCTAPDGDLILVVVAGNTVNVPKKATEAIVSTLELKD